ncbi:MAG: glutamine--fructose-6-phosphate transaminase (isomerizing), partial [Paracoccaceae bacterium]
MCGIVGVLGNHEAAPLLVEALKRLEYRGYDSAGIATVNGGKLDRRRAVGKLVNLSDLLVHQPLAGKSGIGQTRWATHGAVTVPNAHPHRSGPVVVVHNGIIENFRELREELTAQGLTFESQTDTESVVVLTRSYLDHGMTPLQAVQQTVARLRGAYALCFLFDGMDDLMIGTRHGAPLAVGYGQGENFIGSDALALAPMTDRISYLEDDDVAVVTRTSVEIHDREGRLANRAMVQVSLDQTRVEKAGYKHFMAKEIAEQPVVIADALAHYTTGGVNPALRLPPEVDFAGVDRVT